REPGGGTAPSAGHTSSDKKLYREAMEHFKRHQLAVAMIWFGKLIKQYPGSSLKGNALFWQGECYYGMKKYSLAMARYQEVLKKFSTHAKAPDALFKMAMSRLRSGSKKSGRTLLARVLELYPNSAVASKASRELERTRD
ncbi:tol-pal system protein YbgF, partial [Myxococcota bacterium]|nr:tol-pal system protein YbgF [Myxococcota bacterium]